MGDSPPAETGINNAPARSGTQTPAEDPVQRALERFQGHVLNLMAKKWRLYFRDPELRRALGDLNEVLADICRLRSETVAPWARAEFLALGRVDETQLLHIDFAYAWFNRLSRLVSELAGSEYVLVRQAGESLRLDDSGQKLPWPPSVVKLVESSESLLPSQQPLDLPRRERLLKEAWLFREREYTRKVLHSHARRRTKSRLLLAFAPWLLALILGFTALMRQAAADPTDFHLVALAAVAGALGAILSGFFRLRDALNRLGEVRAFGAAMVVQSLAGAAFGMVLGTVMQGGVLGVQAPAGSDPADVHAVFGFIAGFSEPFALGLIAKAVGDLSSRSDGAADGSRGETAG